MNTTANIFEDEINKTINLLDAASNSLIDALSRMSDGEAADALSGVIVMLEDRRSALAATLKDV